MILMPRRFPHTLTDEAAIMADTASAPGAVLQEWEQAIARCAGTRHAVGLNSGRQGMTLILKHLGIGAGDEVIVPAYTLGALIPLVQALGAVAVPADVDLRTMNVTAASVAGRMTDKTKAVIVLHTFGAPAPVDEIARLAESKGVAVVEDCAHSLGATLHGRATGSFGYAGFYSFEITKPVNTYGGGMVVSDNPELVDYIRDEIATLPADYTGLAGKVKAARTERLMMTTGAAWPVLYMLSHPLTRNTLAALYRSRQTVPSSGAAYTPVQARLGLRKLESLDQRVAWRNRLAEKYRFALRPEVQIQDVMPGARSTWYFLVAVLPVPAADVRLGLLRRGIDCAVGEEVADDTATPLGYHDCPNAAHLQKHAVALPMFDAMTEAQVARVARSLNAVLG
jgi:perosamine synthetase